MWILQLIIEYNQTNKLPTERCKKAKPVWSTTQTDTVQYTGVDGLPSCWDGGASTGSWSSCAARSMKACLRCSLSRSSTSGLVVVTMPRRASTTGVTWSPSCSGEGTRSPSKASTRLRTELGTYVSSYSSLGWAGASCKRWGLGGGTNTQPSSAEQRIRRHVKSITSSHSAVSVKGFFFN